MNALVLLLPLLLEGPVAPVIRAEGTSGCPDGGAVAQRLAGLLNGGGEPAAPDLVDLSFDGADLLLRLSRADGTLVAERRIPRSRRCAELADAVAALVAAWEADLRPESSPPAAPASAPRRAPLPVLVDEPPPPAETGPSTYEVGVLPALWVGGGRFSYAGVVRAGVWSRRAPVGMALSYSATFPSGTENRWRRHAFSAGVMGRLRHDWLFVDGLGDVVLGWLVVNEQGVGSSHATFDPGLSVGLRAGTRVSRRLELYLSLAAWGAAWSDGERPGSGAVPHWGLLTGLGGSFLLGL
jgi:hypothetical protein